MEYEAAYEQHREQISRHSRVTFVPGLEPEDVASEMMLCLWRACQTWTEAKGQFAPYWWSLWLNRKADIIRQYNAGKRIHPIPVETLPEPGYGVRLFPYPPEMSDPVGRLVWMDIAVGYTPTEVRKRHRLSSRKYYSMLAKWRTDEVLQMLRST